MIAAQQCLQRMKAGRVNVAFLQNKANRILSSISTESSSSAWVMNDGSAKISTRLFSAPAAAYNQTVDIFPSIVIGSDGVLSAQGPFAESQAQVSDIWHPT
jgi:hypothetical protein